MICPTCPIWDARHDLPPGPGVIPCDGTLPRDTLIEDVDLLDQIPHNSAGDGLRLLWGRLMRPWHVSRHDWYAAMAKWRRAAQAIIQRTTP